MEKWKEWGGLHIQSSSAPWASRARTACNRESVKLPASGESMIRPQAAGLPGSMVWWIPDRSTSGRVWPFLRSAPAEQAPRITFRVARESGLPGAAAREEGECSCGGFGSGLLLLRLLELRTWNPSPTPQSSIASFSLVARLPGRRRAASLVAQELYGRISLCESA